MKKVFYLLLMILSFSILVGCNLEDLNQGEKTEEVEEGIKELKTPSVSISSDGIASWKEVKNATGYAYIINDSKDKSKEKTTKKTEVKLKLGESIKVKALGDGENYEDSPYSKTVVYTGEAVEETVEKTDVKTEEKYVTVWLHPNGGEGEAYPVKIYYELGEYALIDYCDFILNGYECIGWSLTPDGDVYFRLYDKIYDIEKLGNEIHLYAVWESLLTIDPVGEYRITFHANYGGDSTRTQYIYSNEEAYLMLCEFYRDGFEFVGWSIDRSDNVKYKDGQNIGYLHSDLDLYAVWKEKDTNPGELRTANGLYNYSNATYEDRTEILGLLEKYAVKNHLTGMTLFDDGQYVMYHPSVVKGSNEYISGYGFGVLEDGYLQSDLEGENNNAWKRYYHTYMTYDPGTINYLNDKGSDVVDLYEYVASNYFDTAMNEFKDGYNWVGVQSKSSQPEALNAYYAGGTYLATRYRIEVKVGSEFRYNTLSNDWNISKYNGREVQLEDYITAYKILFTRAYGMVRGSENLEDAGSIKGVYDYYYSTSEGFNSLAWENVGIKAYVEDGKSYLEFEFNEGCNQFYAMYYLKNYMVSPVPADFITDLGYGSFEQGIQAWGSACSDSWTGVDTWLSTGPYTIEQWDRDSQIVFRKNPYYKLEDETRYQIAGIHVNILNAAQSDPNAALYEFEAGKLHSCSIPQEKIAEYKYDPRTVVTKGTSTFKLNFNSCTQEEWVMLFGENGSVMQTNSSDYWMCEPIMSNNDFLNGLSYSIHRIELADILGKTPTNNYFSNVYLADPSKGIMYNDTQIHKDAMAELTDGTDYGYNFEYAVASFKKAAFDMIAEGYYKYGDKVSIEIAWMYPTDEDRYHIYIKNYIETAWEAANTGLDLEITYWDSDVWSDVYYEKMMKGQFDIAFGSIAGNTLNPLNFLEVLKSDNSSGYTLNWGCDTSEISEDLFYDGVYWSFDSLWLAADSGAYFVNGKAVDYITVDSCLPEGGYIENPSGSITLIFDLDIFEAEGLEVNLTKGVVFTYLNDEYYGYQYSETEIDYVYQNGQIITTIPADVADNYKNNCYYNEATYTGFDIYYTVQFDGYTKEYYKTINFIWQ